MRASEVPRAVAAAMSSVSAQGLPVDDAIVLQDANRLVLRLLPCDVVARVAPMEYQASAAFEVALAQRLAESDCPVAALEPRLEPRVYVSDGFVSNMWTYYEQLPQAEVGPAVYASALERLHTGMCRVDVPAPHFTDRVAGAQRLVGSRNDTPDLADGDRELLSNTLRSLKRSIRDCAAEQLLHGEPHPGNLLATTPGPLFVDLETCCRGPVEFDLAHAPEEVGDRYAAADLTLLGECRGLVLAMVAAWRWRRGDAHPNGRRAARDLLDGLRGGPPWPTLDAVVGPGLPPAAR